MSTNACDIDSSGFCATHGWDCMDFRLNYAEGCVPAHLFSLVYKPDSNNEIHTQPLSDVDEVGTLIDPETGEDLGISGIKPTQQMRPWLHEN